MHLNFSLVLIPLFLALRHAHAAPLDTSPNDQGSPLVLRQAVCNTVGCMGGQVHSRACVRQGCGPTCGPNGFCNDPDSDSDDSTQTNYDTDDGSQTCNPYDGSCDAEPNAAPQCSGAACDPAVPTVCGAGCSCLALSFLNSLSGRDTTGYICS